VRRLPILLLLLAGCRSEPAPTILPWERLDLWEVKPVTEMAPPGVEAVRPVLSFLGSEEVRDMRRVPESQLSFAPKRTAGQVRALEMPAGTRVRWAIRPGREAYFSFNPLGSVNGCACTYRIGVREGPRQVRELYRVEAAPVTSIAPATVDVDLSEYAGRKVELLLQLDGPAGPTALWGSPAVYGQGGKPATVRTPRTTGKPNIVLIGLDTLRADSVGAWSGRDPSLTPEIDRLAGESDVWLEAFSAFNVTNPSFASILTGLYGKNHGVYDLQTPLPPGHTTLAERLAGAGYDTLALLSAHHLGDRNSGLGQGFREVRLAPEQFAAELPVDQSIDWIGRRAGGERPFFLWLHLFDPHTPHTPPQPFALGFRPAGPEGLAPARTWIPFRQPGARAFVEPVLGGNRDLYDGEVAYLDRQVGRLMGFLASRGLLENTVVALVADHGESLGEHGILFRHLGLHDVTTHVPLLIRWPGREREGRRIEGLVQTIDLFPTLLAAAGLPVPPQDGTDLRELTGDPGEHREGRRAVFAEHSHRTGAMVRTRTHKYFLSEGNGRLIPDGPSLFDLAADPGELKNLAGRGLPAEKELSRLLRRWLAGRRPGPGAQSRELDDEEKARLRALGYG
jgi:arylsulfatase A-like enzyme